MSWVYLFIAAVCEVGWPVGMKLAGLGGPLRWLWIAAAAVAMTLSGVFLYLAQKQIPIGTAYAIWTGVGAAATFAIGVIFFKDSASLIRMLGVALIVGGVIVLKISD
ncbi:MAG: multidrug efflux SMR transporter [Akkermansia sp.]|nr:multidrug efflux SMR transporter [Akkermansia sp.]